jgi:alpha-L-rhamnosidase
MMSDTQTALALALHFHLLPEASVDVARDRLDHLVRKAIFQISTGFAGTPIILHALSDNQLLQHAYRMFQEKQYPSILYPVSMGATTIVGSALRSLGRHVC